MPTELYLYEDIGGFGTSASSFIDQVKAAGDNPIDLRINSVGGDVFEGYAIYNALRRHKAGVNVYIDGLAASIASYIAMAGQNIFMADNAMLMIHLPYGGGGGTSEEMRKNADILDMITKSLVDAYASRTGIPNDEIAKMLDEETWLDAQQALAFGFVDGVTEPLAMAAKFDVRALAKFKNVPAKLKAQMQTEKIEPQINTDETLIKNQESEPIRENPCPPVAENRPSIFARVSGWLKDNAALVNENQSLRAELEGKERESCEYVNKITELQAVVERLEVEVSQFRAAAKDLEDQFEKQKAEAKTASERAVDIVAAAGFPQKDLPAVQPQEAVKSPQQWLDEYNALPMHAQHKFYLDNKAAIDKANAELKAAQKKGKK